MKIRAEHLGVLTRAEFELGDLTIICGKNNTGKTYATYALFGFLYDWRDNLEVKLPNPAIATLMNDGVVRIDITKYVGDSPDILARGCHNYRQRLSHVFGSRRGHFRHTKFSVELDPHDVPTAAKRAFDRKIRSNRGEIFSLNKAEDDTVLVASLLADTANIELPGGVLKDIISSAVNDILFGPVFPQPFIASAERTGAAIFRKELNFARNRLLEEISKTDKDIDPMKFLLRRYQDYPLPVKINVDFIRQLGDVAKKDSFIYEHHREVLDDFADIIGGEYIIDSNDILYFRPTGTRHKLLMEESSSAVRSLLNIGFYLRHAAKAGDLLMVDEPELNLHPENQRRVARLLARLVNLGVRVFATTHSDYIVKELNTLIMLNRHRENLKQLAEQEGYHPEELVAADRVRVYLAIQNELTSGKAAGRDGRGTLVPARIDPEMGIEARSFDETIDRMNDIQGAIIWGGDE